MQENDMTRLGWVGGDGNPGLETWGGDGRGPDRVDRDVDRWTDAEGRSTWKGRIRTLLPF